MKNVKKALSLLLVLVLCTGLVLNLVGCPQNEPDPDPENPTKLYDNETRPFSMSIQAPDGVFNPFFSSSAYDSAVVGQTQIGMLSTDKLGNIVCGENEPTVAKDYTVKEITVGGAAYTDYEFLIKKGIRFSDGVELTIRDVLFNLYVYLDPAYTGSATIYSTNIVGLQNYRLQEEGNISDNMASSIEEGFVTTANKRVQDLIDYVKMVGKGVKADDRPANRWTPEQTERILSDYAYVADTFLEELKTDYNNVDKDSYKDWGFTEVWQIFLYTDGGRTELLLENPEKPGNPLKDAEGNYKLDTAEAARIFDEEIADYIAAHPELSREDAIRTYCIESVYDSYFPHAATLKDRVAATTASQFETVAKYWATAATILDRYTAEAKSDYYGKTDRVVPNVSGITTRRTNTFNGKTLDGEYDVLSIRIHDVDPKAIYNFAFTVAPMHYYSTTNWNNKNYIEAFNGVNEFGLEFGSIQFMNEVVNAPSKVGLPLGAGPYKASSANGENVTAGSFFNNNLIYYERNTYFETVGAELSNAKIKYMRYKVVESDQIINALANGDIDFGDPSATQDNREAANQAGLGHTEILTSGYGYVGINPRFVPNITVRRAIMKAMNTALILENYYKGGMAELIWRPMSTTNWAYPQGVSVYKNSTLNLDYSYDSTGYEIEAMLQNAGYVKNADGIYEKEIEGFGTDRLSGQNYKFTIAGGSADHPAYKMFIEAAKLLNRCGMQVQVVTSQTALSDLSAGKLSIWAAAWSSTIDPDMYQVYHMDSQASSTNNWGYKQIKAGKKTEAYSEEYAIITELSDLIDAGRSTTDVEERKDIYAQALDKVMQLAVEMPTYQRKDMSAYNKNVLDESTMTPVSERSPYNGLLSRIWELSYR